MFNRDLLLRMDAKLDRIGGTLDRVDGTLDRVDGALDRNTDAFDRNTDAFDRHAAASDRHAAAFDRFTAASDRHAAAFDRNTEAFERMDASYHRWAAREDDFRAFIREQTLRMQRASDRQTEALLRVEKRIEAGVLRLEDLAEEAGAQRRALLAVLDRLGPGPAAA